jgi:hypothetical protein
MNAVKHIEYMDRAMNAGAMPAPYAIRKAVDAFGETVNAKLTQQYRAGVAEGWRQARGWQARNTGVLIAFGVCVGVTLAVVFGPMISFIF